MTMNALQPSDRPNVGMVLSYFPSLRGLTEPYTVSSGTLINSQALLTAGHVIYDPTKGNQADMFEIFFGDGSSHQVVGGKGKVRREWKSAGNDPLSMWDFGVILLDQDATPVPALPTQTSTNDLLGAQLNVRGFPADNLVPQYYGSLFEAVTSAYRMSPPYDGYRIGYLEYTYAGMSGGPVLRADEINNATFQVRAVHTSLYNNMGNGLMISSSVYGQIMSWIAGN
jgi:V8-like Glu-specific endopeptidase